MWWIFLDMNKDGVGLEEKISRISLSRYRRTPEKRREQNRNDESMACCPHVRIVYYQAAASICFLVEY
jgi:hypothetical protein